MPHFIKAGFWEKAKTGYRDWLNLDLILSSIFQKITNFSTVIEDGTSVSVTSIKETLETAESAIVVDISYLGDDSTIELTLNTTASTLTFPSGALCVSEGVASGDNTLVLSGVSGDKYIIGIKKFGSSYYVVAKNFGQ